MCLAIPAKIIALLENERAVVNLGGIKKEVSLSLVENIKEGDYVVIHVGYVIARLDEAEAQKTLKILSEIATEVERTAS
ncbi:HypC/HybG/HupF family hydrogenase formation chaperone [Aquicella lusitana]|jgi:hydrogenase assembly chaperone HypC/HupF|uniref:Hydrogenase maturation protein HypC n=1 Tax=Aquicella lusitana TaxID=254246 RepID=A0A370GJK4_9COXI|nr:HypC/HybG/HupF family hydrogenase formation chaperone [Aquicella lusitana]RDI43416.1 hydrogenase maturation protein HypC [Aquicella lusitana]VVC73566.1 Hydrogenase isoenzymes formation protein HypC [Aquicella lusitana]